MQNEQLDPKVVNLAKAIKRAETGTSTDAYNAKGQSGENGAYQFMPETWKGWAKQHLGDENAGMSVQNQNKVAYTQIKQWKDAGLSPAQIASKWNSGDENAYKTGKKGSTFIGGKEIQYDVPAYTSKVSGFYGELNSGQPATEVPQGGEVPSETVNATEPNKRGLLGKIAHSIGSPIATMLARPIQAGAAILGASSESIDKATQNIAGDWVAPVPQTAQDVLKDVGRGAQTAALALPLKGVASVIKTGTVAGAGAGLEKTGTLEGGLKGGAIGAGTGLVTGGLGAGFKLLPKWLAKGAYGLTDDQATRMLATKTIGTKVGLVTQSQTSLAKSGETVRGIIKAADNVVPSTGKAPLLQTLEDFPEYKVKGGIAKMFIKIQKLFRTSPEVGSRGELIAAMDRIAKGTATWSDKNLVRSGIDSVTNKTWVKLKKGGQLTQAENVAIKFASNLRDDVKRAIPETVEIFDDMAKEVDLQKMLKLMIDKRASGLLKFTDIIGATAGYGLGGMPGGLLTAGLMRGLHSPAVRFGIAKTLGTVVPPVVQAGTRGGTSGLLPGLLKM